MKYLPISLVVILSLLAYSCNKDSAIDPIIVSSMADMVVDQDFQWTSGLHGTLELNLINPHNVSTEYEYISIVREGGEVVDRKQIVNGTASFSLDLPQDAPYYLYYPITGDMQVITAAGMVDMELGPTLYDTKSRSMDAEVVSCTVCDDPMVNGGAEDPVINQNWTLVHEDNVPGWLTTSTDGKIELWTTGFLGVQAQEGIQFMELNATQVAALYQELCLEPGSTVQWSVWHRGRQGVDVAEVKIGATVETAEYLQTMTDGKDAWGYYSGNYTVPEGQETTVFVFESVSAAGGNNSVGNFIDNFEILCDFDGDGVPDGSDDNPEDADVAFTSYFPTSGKQVVAFEDLWPSLGDFDFNDVVLSNQVVISKRADFSIIEADFKVSIDAIGAGLDNGIALMLYDANGAAFADNVIASVEGDISLDPDNTNGLILTEDVFLTTNERYQNNGIGTTTDEPDTLYFSIQFESAVLDFTPELYIFRTDDRAHEVHRPGFPGTAIVDNALFNTADDNGNYKTANGLPWGLEILTSGTFKNPIERVEILNAYPQFELWATSSGEQNVSWYTQPVNDKVVDIFAK